jgi:hypothetical protein
VALKYLSGTTEVSLAEINNGFGLSIQGMLAYQTDRYVQSGVSEAITIPGTNIKWIQSTFPNPILVPPIGASISQSGRQGLLRYFGDDLVYNVLMEANITSQPVNKSLDYRISLEYPIEDSAIRRRLLLLPIYFSGPLKVSLASILYILSFFLHSLELIHALIKFDLVVLHDVFPFIFWWLAWLLRWGLYLHNRVLLELGYRAEDLIVCIIWYNRRKRISCD